MGHANLRIFYTNAVLVCNSFHLYFYIIIINLQACINRQLVKATVILIFDTRSISDLQKT